MVIGPVSPFRSGISAYTTGLARQLAVDERFEVRVISFSRQYPRALFPGESDRDESLGRLEVPATDYLLDTVNPLTWWSALRRIREFGPALVVVPAWTFFVAPCLGWLSAQCRRLGLDVISVVHNVSDHESSAWKRWLSDYQLRQATGFLVHNQSMGNELRSLFPDRQPAVHALPVNQLSTAAQEVLPRGAELELLFFGLVRPYKGLDIALQALALLGQTSVRLTVVGEFWEDVTETEALIANLGIADRVELVPRYVSDAEAAAYFQRCDVVLMPYRSATGSAVIPLAYSLARPVIATNLSGLAEVVDHGETGWLLEENTPEAISELLHSTVSRVACEQMHPALAAKSVDLGWTGYVTELLSQVRPTGVVE